MIDLGVERLWVLLSIREQWNQILYQVAFIECLDFQTFTNDGEFFAESMIYQISPLCNLEKLNKCAYYYMISEKVRPHYDPSRI